MNILQVDTSGTANEEAPSKKGPEIGFVTKLLNCFMLFIPW